MVNRAIGYLDVRDWSVMKWQNKYGSTVIECLVNRVAVVKRGQSDSRRAAPQLAVSKIEEARAGASDEPFGSWWYVEGVV